MSGVPSMVEIRYLWPEVERIESGGFEGGRESVARENGRCFRSLKFAQIQRRGSWIHRGARQVWLQKMQTGETSLGDLSRGGRGRLHRKQKNRTSEGLPEF